MIISFKDSKTEKIYNLARSRRLPSDIQQVALRKLRMINNARTINDLRVPPANRLEKLSAIEPDNTAFASTINGEFVLIGRTIMLTMLR